MGNDGHELAVLIELAGLLAPDLPDIAGRVRLAADDPKAYRARFPDDSWSTDETLAAFAHVLGAAHQDLLVWTDDEAEVWNVDDPEINDDTPPGRLIALIAGRLEQHELRCINLGGGSDTYCLALVPRQHFERSLACARWAGFLEYIDPADEARATGCAG